VLGLLPWAAFGHSIVSAPRGAMMFFFVLGLLTSLRHFPLPDSGFAIKEVQRGDGRRVTV
jgi:hypothetical protein